MASKGDGKGMQASNCGEKYWDCSDATILHRMYQVDEEARWGSYLRRVVPLRRIGDYAHCRCSITNTINKRLHPTIERGGVPFGREGRRKLLALWDRLALDAQSIPSTERIAQPLSKKQGQLDLTACTFFWDNSTTQREVIDILKEHFRDLILGDVHLYMLVSTIVNTFAGLHRFWQQCTLLSAQDISCCERL